MKKLNLTLKNKILITLIFALIIGISIANKDAIFSKGPQVVSADIDSAGDTGIGGGDTGCGGCDGGSVESFSTETQDDNSEDNSDDHKCKDKPKKGKFCNTPAPTPTPQPTLPPTPAPIPTPTQPPVQPTPQPTQPPVVVITQPVPTPRVIVIENKTREVVIQQPAPQVVRVVQTQTKTLPKTGLPIAALALLPLLPAGLKLRKYGSDSQELDTPNFIWEERELSKV